MRVGTYLRAALQLAILDAGFDVHGVDSQFSVALIEIVRHLSRSAHISDPLITMAQYQGNIGQIPGSVHPPANANVTEVGRNTPAQLTTRSS